MAPLLAPGSFSSPLHAYATSAAPPAELLAVGIDALLHLTPPLPSHLALSRLRGGFFSAAASEMSDQSVQAYEWTVNVATAGALVAGGSLASLFDHGLHVDLSQRTHMIGGKHVAQLVHHVRMFSSVLLSLSFAFEICVVFSATVTGTMLLSGGRSEHPFDPLAFSATHLLQRELEFEYCLIRAGFFQGLINWLTAIGLRFVVSLMAPPDEAEVDGDNFEDNLALAQKRMWLGLGLMLMMFSLVAMMLSFYNYHLNYYPNYFAMLHRLGVLAWERYIVCFPVRVLPLVGAVFFVSACLLISVSFMWPFEPRLLEKFVAKISPARAK
ncbi:hypothetical protein AB1Y20_010229 [Prymnesium parvum]|uniref:Uncharacterized protein n=1 Tax=Prymnesium parvum TaxID=97485 RepID=A0AB34K678_PRYPA